MSSAVKPWNTLDWLFPSDNEYDIPSLEPQEKSGVDLPVTAWGSIGRSLRMPGTWHLYVDDYRFDGLFTTPHKLVSTECVAATEANCSIFPQTPRAVALSAIYKKRWLSRYWQTYGVRIFVDLNVPERYEEENLLGVPDGWTHFSTRGYDRKLALLDGCLSVASTKAGRLPLLVVCGGGARVADWCRSNTAVHVPYGSAKNPYSAAESP